MRFPRTVIAVQSSELESGAFGFAHASQLLLATLPNIRRSWRSRLGILSALGRADIRFRLKVCYMLPTRRHPVREPSPG